MRSSSAFSSVYGFACYVPVCVCINVGVSREVRPPPRPRGDIWVLQGHLLERLTSFPPSLCLCQKSHLEAAAWFFRYVMSGLTGGHGCQQPGSALQSFTWSCFPLCKDLQPHSDASCPALGGAWLL